MAALSGLSHGVDRCMARNMALPIAPGLTAAQKRLRRWPAALEG